MTGRRLALLLAAAAALGAPALAHEVRPAYLELRERAGGEVDVLFKTPAVGDRRLALRPALAGTPSELEPLAGVATRVAGGAAIQTWSLRLAAPLRGRALAIEGLEGTMTDALVRVELADGGSFVERLTPRAPATTIPVRAAGANVARTYLALGVEHILLGVDHLLFVLGLLLLTDGAGRLVRTVTAFTLAHSITLALAALGFVHVPQAPVEATIALSIAFVAAEVLRARAGEPGLAARAPWLVALAFGLLHGFGFAGALAEIGLPEGRIPLALLFFNLGVEAGQLLFVLAVLAYLALARRARVRLPRWAEPAPAYALGAVAMFWVFQRVADFR